MAKGKEKTGRLSVFKGRETKLNKAIFHILARKSPQTIYDIHKEVKTQRGLRQTRYANVNKRVRALEKSGYVKKVGVKKTKTGFQASTYELTSRAHLVMILSQTNLDHFVEEAEDEDVLSALAALTSAARLLSADRNHAVSESN